MATKTVKLNVIERALLKLKGGDPAAVRATLDTVSRAWDSRVTKANLLLVTLNQQKKEALIDLEFDLAEAEISLTESYSDVRPIKSHTERKAYVKEYEAQIDNANRAVKSIEKTIASVTDKYDEDIEIQEKAITTYKKMLAELDKSINVEIEIEDKK